MLPLSSLFLLNYHSPSKKCNCSCPHHMSLHAMGPNLYSARKHGAQRWTYSWVTQNLWISKENERGDKRGRWTGNRARERRAHRRSLLLHLTLCSSWRPNARDFTSQQTHWHIRISVNNIMTEGFTGGRAGREVGVEELVSHTLQPTTS